MGKEHKKLYKAGKLWVTATLTVLAGIMVATTTSYADTTVNQQSDPVSQQQPTSNSATGTSNESATSSSSTAPSQAVQNQRIALPENQSVALPVAQQSNDAQQNDVVDDVVDKELQSQIAAAQKAVDEQRQVVTNDETALAAAKQERDQTAQADKIARAKSDEAFAKYMDASAQEDAAFKYWRELSSKVVQQPEYQALLQKAKAMCPGYFSGDPTVSIHSRLKLLQQSEEKYQEFNSLLTQMNQLRTPIKKAEHDYDVKHEITGKASQAFGIANKDSEQAEHTAQLTYNKWEEQSYQLRKDDLYLAYLLNQLAALKQKELTELQKHFHTLEITYVDKEGNVVGTKSLTAKNGEDVTIVVKQAPDNYHYADDPQKSFKIADSNQKITVIVDQNAVQPTIVHEQVNYVDADGQIVGSQILSGQPGQQFIAGNLQLPTGYKIVQDGPLLITLGDADGQFTVHVAKINTNHPVDMSQNYGYLDSYSAMQGKLHLAGWHVSSASADYRYPYIIVLDNGQEIGRAQAQLVDRPDVDRLYPNTTNRQAAGFTADVTIPTYAYGDHLTVIARFSNDPAGNGQYQDYWFNNLNPVTDLNANQAYLDSYQLSTNSRNGDIQLNVSGWHAAGRSVTETNHWLILFDKTTNSEIQRVSLLGNGNYVISRPDVARTYPKVANSGQAGFNGLFTLDPAQLGHTLVVISRYSDDAVNGEGNKTDYWLPAMHFDNGNYASLDNNRISGNKLQVSGWHATNQAAGMTKHFIILYDATQHRELSRQLSQVVNRPDVSRVYPTIADTEYSGFNVNFNLVPEMAQDEIQIISRWTSSEDGNSNYVDYWFAPQLLVTDQSNQAYLDSFKIVNGQLKASGWHASNLSFGKPYHYIILFDRTAGHEVSRLLVMPEQRLDVARVYPTILTAADSGFSAGFNFDPDRLNGHQLQIVSRWTDDQLGNGNATDYWFAPQSFVISRPAPRYFRGIGDIKIN